MSSLAYMQEHGLCLKCARRKCYHPPHPFMGARSRRRFIRTGPKREFMSQFPPVDEKVPLHIYMHEWSRRESMWSSHCMLEHLEKFRSAHPC